ncbi:MAG: multicopper oxidase domain-containing protein [Methylococcales bacterium]
MYNRVMFRKLKSVEFMFKKYFVLSLLVIVTALNIVTTQWFPIIKKHAREIPPTTVFSNADNANIEKPCTDERIEWRDAQEIEGVKISASPACEPDNPYTIATAVKGTNNVSMMTLMQSNLAQDAITMGEDLDKDGDPDEIYIKLEVVELNGFSPDGDYLMNTYNIAPGLQPSLWVFAPKMQGMAVKNFNSQVAHPLLRAPSPVIRVEQGDKVFITLENTHYLPHTIHLHGVDHPFLTAAGHDNDGMEEHAVFPGKQHTYEIQPRHAGTMLYHCHVQTAQHFMMGLNGMFIVEENAPNNWVQTFNIGAGQVRHSAVSVQKNYDQEYDLHYQSIDKELAKIPQEANDPRLISQKMSRDYNMTTSNENYFLLNGHSFPYTLRDAMIIVNENERVKIHAANLQRSPIAVHFHGHKATITAYDGVDAPQGLQLTRDVFDISPAQRLDLSLNTKNDGLNSYGAGLWMFHDHTPTGTTTDGMEPGGNITLLAYKSFLDAQGMPKMHDELFNDVFNKEYYAKQRPLWANGEWASFFGDAGKVTPNYSELIAFCAVIGLLIGAFILTLHIYLQNRIHEKK